MCFVDLLFSVRFRLEFIANATTNVQNEKKGRKNAECNINDRTQHKWQTNIYDFLYTPRTTYKMCAPSLVQKQRKIIK